MACPQRDAINNRFDDNISYSSQMVKEMKKAKTSQAPRKSKEYKVAISVVALLIVLVGGGMFLVNNVMNGGYVDNESEVQVTKVDVSSESESKLPENFPAGVPVEEGSVTESYTALYTKHNVVQYSVNYSTQRDKRQVWDEYVNYLNANGYRVVESDTNFNKGVLLGVNGTKSLNVVIYNLNQELQVALNYLSKR